MIFLFDFDNTLVNTIKLKPYRTTREGHQYITNNPTLVPSQSIDDSLPGLLESYQYRSIIASNASTNQIEILLAKHHFPQLPVYGNLKKPVGPEFQALISSIRGAGEDAIIIGDSPHDILAAHHNAMASIAVSWGQYSKRQLQKAQPTRIVDNVDELNTTLQEAASGKLVPTPYVIKPHLQLYNPSFLDPEITPLSLGTYIPWGTGQSDQHSKDILTYKAARDYTFKQLENHQTSQYFWNGSIRAGTRIKSVVDKFFNQVSRRVESLDLKGTTQLIAAPNCLPSYCYLLDTNHLIAFNVNKDHEQQRLVERVLPKQKSTQGERSKMAHYRTMALNVLLEQHQNAPNNIVIFDDVSTTGSQLDVIGSILRSSGFNENLYSLTLGTTSGDMF